MTSGAALRREAEASEQRHAVPNAARSSPPAISCIHPKQAFEPIVRNPPLDEHQLCAWDGVVGRRRECAWHRVGRFLVPTVHASRARALNEPANQPDRDAGKPAPQRRSFAPR